MLEIRLFVTRQRRGYSAGFKNAGGRGYVITTGGLGPIDDLTRETIAKALGVKLEFVDSVRVELEARRETRAYCHCQQS